jgi:hypothetical protein
MSPSALASNNAAAEPSPRRHARLLSPPFRRPASTTVLAVAGAGLSALGLIDRTLPGVGVGGCLLAVVSAALSRRRGGGTAPVLLAVASTAYLVGALAGPEFRADAAGYYVYLRSAALDHDLDFANEWEAWRFPPLPVTATGLRPNLYSVGPALFWSPFFVAAHLYVRLTGPLYSRPWPDDGYSPPYLGALAVASITYVIAGAYVLVSSMRKYLTIRQATIVVAGAILTSSIAYYAFIVPAMGHALTCSLTCLVIWAWHEADEVPSLRTWSMLGLFMGLLTLTRWQGLVVGLLPAALAIRQLWQWKARPTWILAGAAAAFLAFLPQMIAWKLIFGRWVTMPQGQGYVDWTSPHFVDVLFSAERGFFNWTPMMLLGTVGLIVLARRMPLFAGAGLAVVVATAWVNGGVRDWEASDAFAARRFDLAVPFAAWGLAALCRVMAMALHRRPWAAVATLLALFSLWNAGFIRLFRSRGFIDAAPFEYLARAQAHQLYRLLDEAAARAGPRTQGFLYNVMVGEYFYYNVNLSGTIDVGALDSRWLAGGWSEPERREGWPSFRWALYPRACIRVPLQAPIALRSFIRARSPGRLSDQSMRIVSNGVAIATVPLSREWTDIPFTVPAASLRPGENGVCFEFSRTLPGESNGGNAAAVALIQLP